MKHTVNRNNIFVPSFIKKPVAIFLFGALALCSSCKKDFSGADRSVSPDPMRVSASTTELLQNVQYQIGRESYNAIEVTYDSNRHVGGLNFCFGDGSVRSIPITLHAGKYVKVEYRYDKSSTKLQLACANGTFFMDYGYDDLGNLSRSNYDDTNDPSNNYYILYSTSSVGDNIHDKYTANGEFIERTVYAHNADGTFRSIEKYDPASGMKLKGKIVFHNNYTAEQLANWRRTIAVFPEPVLPFYIMMMLSEKIEMQIEPGYCCDDVIVDGQIITVLANSMWASGKKVQIDFCKTDKGSLDVIYPTEMLSFNYGKI